MTAFLGGGVLLGAVVWMGWLWWRTPGIVRETEATIAEPLNPSELPNRWLEDLLAVEDPAFRSHHGIDLSTPGAGWTTITQGLAKDLYFDEFRPGPLQKLEQSLAALVLDARASKDQQLRLFLGRAYLGEAPTGSEPPRVPIAGRHGDRPQRVRALRSPRAERRAGRADRTAPGRRVPIDRVAGRHLRNVRP